MDKKLLKEGLENGKLLEAAIRIFNEDNSEDNLFILLGYLRNSDIWVPCNSVISEEDQKDFLSMLEQANGRL